MMGMSFGLFWANRDYLALSTTKDENRNYYYGLETFFYTNTYVIVPVAIGWFIEGTGRQGWFGGEHNTAYQIVTVVRVPADDLCIVRRAPRQVRQSAATRSSSISNSTGCGIACSCWRSSKALARVTSSPRRRC